MPLDALSTSARALDRCAVHRIVGRLSAQAAAPWLHAEAARRMAERLSLIRQPPRAVLEWGGWLGASREALDQACRQASRRVVEPSVALQQRSREQRRGAWWRWGRAAVDVQLPDQLTPGCADLVWANMVLQGEPDPPALFSRWHDVLAVDGFLMFSTLGPGTLQGLRELYAAQGWGSPMAALVDMHDLGDMLVQAGFADPVMDQETLTLTWASPEALLAELRGLGGNADPQRDAGLRTPRWRQRLLQALAARADAQGRIAMDFELVYGHAFRVAARPRVQAQTEVSLQAMREMVRSRRTPGG